MKKNPSCGVLTTNSPQPDVICLVLKVPEFGMRYGVSRRTVFTWMSKGLPHLKLSTHKVLIPIREGDNWMEKNYYRQRLG